MDAQAIIEKIKAGFGEGAVESVDLEAMDPFVVIRAPIIDRVCAFLKSDPELSFDSLQLLSAVDAGEELVVVYHLFSMRHRHWIVLKAMLTDRENPHLPTVDVVWRGANWHEREAYDMMGIVFDGSRDLRRILCPDDWDGFPLRKDYEQPEFYNGMRVRPTEQMVEEARRTAGGIGGFGVGPFD